MSYKRVRPRLNRGLVLVCLSRILPSENVEHRVGDARHAQKEEDQEAEHDDLFGARTSPVVIGEGPENFRKPPGSTCHRAGEH